MAPNGTGVGERACRMPLPAQVKGAKWRNMQLWAAVARVASTAGHSLPVAQQDKAVAAQYFVQAIV
jgi:hypothetical protein